MKLSLGCFRICFYSGLSLSGLLGIMAAPASAAVFNVNSLADILNPPAGVVTLRSAIQAANSAPGADTLNLTVPGIYRITLQGTNEDLNATGDFDLLPMGDLSIGNASGGKVVIDGNGLDRVFDVNPAAAPTAFTLTMQGFTIQGGVTDFSTGDGGGIRVQGNAGIALAGMTLANNKTRGNGGGIAFGSASNGSSLINTTLTDNGASGNGGGIHLAAGFSGSLLLVNDTISGNFATNGGGVYWSGSNDLRLQNTIIARNNLPHSLLFTAQLNGANQATPTNSPATATAAFLLSADQTTLTVNGSFSGLLGTATAFHVHNGPPGVTGPLVTDATGNPLEFTGLPAATSGSIPQQNFTVTAAVVAQLLAGNLYTNLHTTAFPGGEIRSQFSLAPGYTITPGSGPDIFTGQLFTAQLNGANQAPPTNSPATATAAFLLSADQTTLTVNGSFSGLLGTATAFHVHNGPPGVTGPLVTDVNGNPLEFTGLPAATSGSIPQQNFTVTAAVVAQLLAGNLYTNLHTTAFPGGEIRSQFSLAPGALIDLGHNLISVSGPGSGNTGFTGPGTLTGTAAAPLDPALGSLADNGGPTSTLTPLTGSPALDAGDDAVLNPPFSLTTDQRGAGFSRKFGLRVDIGSLEAVYDSIPPVTTAAGQVGAYNSGTAVFTPSGLYASGGWTNKDVQVAFSATDTGGSGLKTPGITVGATGASPVATQSVSSGTAFTVTAPGATNFTYHAEDLAGNSEASRTFQVNIDRIPPTITASAKTADGLAYTPGAWTNQNVIVHYTCADTGDSGVSGSCPPDVTVTASQTVAGATISDVAGNTATSAAVIVKIDKVPPVITYSVHPASYTVDQTVKISCTATDALSGIAPGTSVCQDVNAPAYAFPLGITTLSAKAKDNAGNLGTGTTTFTVKVTYIGLGFLVVRFTDKRGLQNDLLEKLAHAGLEALRGRTKERNQQLDVFIKQVQNNSAKGKDLTPAQGAILIALAKALQA